MNISQITQLLSANAEDTNGASIVVERGGLYKFAVDGTFGGATVKLAVLGPDGATYMAAASVTSAGISDVELPAGYTVRGEVSGGTATSVNATLGFVR